MDERSGRCPLDAAMAQVDVETDRGWGRERAAPGLGVPGRVAYLGAAAHDPSATTSTAFYLQCRRCGRVRPLVDSEAGPYPMQDADYGASM
jgi:hypothetical protein